VLFAVLTAAVLYGCEEADDRGSFAAVEEVILITDPESLSFNSTGLGEESQQILTIQNQSNVPATMIVTLSETPTPNDQNEEFAWAGNLDSELRNEVTLEGNQSRTLVLTYKPQDNFRDTGQIKIVYNNDKSIIIPIESNDISPDIDGPTRVIFGRVPGGGHAQKTIQIQNIGRAPLEMGQFFLSDEAAEFSFCFPQEGGSCLNVDAAGAYPSVLEYLETIQVMINYDPVDDGEDSTQLKIQSNDPDEQPFIIDLNANGAEPCIIVTNEDGLDFNTGFIGAISQRTLSITNCSPTKNLEISSIIMTSDSDEEYFIDALLGGLPDTIVTVGIEGTTSFVVNYAPDAEESNTGTIQILSNDDAKSPLLIPVLGRGSNNACPTAVGKAREVGTAQPLRNAIDTIPLTTIQFDAGDSFDPDTPDASDAIAAYEWTIIERPTDSTTRFVPNSSVRDPQLFLDLAGVYVIELRVFDQQNTPSCEAARINILATPDEDIHVQLVWETPGDPDQTDSGTGNGSDLDLHLLHPAGNWNEPPYDCFWRNIEPDWGNINEGSDNPSLDIDDTDGAGPENTNLNNPENITYRVGAFYFSDHNFGPSYATIRIFLSQVLVYEYRDKYIDHTGNFWDAATIEWGTSPRVNQIDQVYDGYP
jgi:hypothetical protein